MSARVEDGDRVELVAPDGTRRLVTVEALIQYVDERFSRDLEKVLTDRARDRAESEVVPAERIEEALAILREAGLVAKVAIERPLQIVGGTAERDAGGITSYDGGFVVAHDPKYWGFRGSISGPGNESKARGGLTLREAAAFVAGHYVR